MVSLSQSHCRDNFNAAVRSSSELTARVSACYVWALSVLLLVADYPASSHCKEICSVYFFHL